MDLETLEQLAFADRSAALAALLPGTVEHDYWRGVSFQHEGRLAEVDEILSNWTQRHGHGHDELHERLRRRQLLLRANADLAATADELRREANVVLNDQAEVVIQAQHYPTRLDPELIDGDRLLHDELGRRPDLSTVSDFALPELVGRLREDDITRRRSLLQRLDRTNIPGLVALIAADLDDRSSSGFGSLGVHKQLTLAQLEELANERPSLRTQSAWVDAVLTRLRPPSWVDLRVDIEEHRALLDRSWGFVSGLADSFNSLKAQVLYRRLELDRSRGEYDRSRFVAYLKLPRKTHYVARDWLERVPAQHLAHPGDLAVRAAGLEPIGDDEPLVRDYLARFLLEEDGSAFTTWLRAEWVEEQLATTRLLAGATGADAERWAKVLGPTRLTALKDRVDIDLAPQNPVARRANDDVALEVDVKNVRELEVKVFRINTLSYFLAKGADVDTSIDLDGMIASGERLELRFDAPPLRRMRRRIELPACKRPGTYIVELIGNGRSSRALIRKGSLRHSVRIGAAGPVLTIMDEDGVPLQDASLWLGGRELRAREERTSTGASAGGITIPFSTRPGLTPILLVHGDVTQREVLQHPAEDVRLVTGLHLERESLVPNQIARVLCRPTLMIGGAPAPVALLEDVRAEVSVTDLAGTSSSRTQPLTFREDGETVVEINVPDGVTNVSVRIRGRVRVVSTQQTIEVEDGASATVNAIHTTEQTASVHLVKNAPTTTQQGSHYELHVLGKTGEALPGRPVSFSLHHRNVRTSVDTTLETNERGVIDLGALDGIDRITASLPSGVQRSWSLESATEIRPIMHALEDEAIVVPVPDGTRAQDLSLTKLRGGVPARDVTAQISLQDRCAVVRLAPGDYRLSGKRIPVPCMITVAPRTGAAARSGWAVCGQAMYELTPPLPLVRSFVHEGDEIVLRLSGTTAQTRVHLIGTRFFKDAALPSSLYQGSRAPLAVRSAPALSSYVSGRDIGDEYRYVIERRSARRRPGTMLEKPSLLLNPWALRTTTTGVQVAATGAAYPPPPPMASAPAPAPHARAMAHAREAGPSEEPGFPSVDFLSQGAIVIDNLRPDADGIVRIPVADLGSGTGAAQLVQAIVVDPLLTSRADLALPPQTAAPRDLRLRLALDPVRHYAEDRSVAAAPAGTSIVIPDVRTGKIELIDTLARAHQLLLTLTNDGDLRELSFVTDWSSLDEATRRARYSKYACHELHLFLWRKDPSFFESVVRPYLAHKREKTFVDRFLLGEDLSSYLEPWSFGRMNTVECILLGSRIREVSATVARLIGDAVDVLPQDPGRDAHLVATLLGASALEGGSVAVAAGESPDKALFEVAAAEMPEEAVRSAAPKKRAMPKGARPSAALGGQAPSALAGGYGGNLDVLADLEERRRTAPLYRGADKTQEWAETGWWKRRIGAVGPDLIPPNRFWRDLARREHDAPSQPFLSPHIGDCTSSFAEAMCALAFLDLPFVPEPHDTKLDDMSLTVTPRSHALAARARIVEIAPTDGAAPRASTVLIGQSYFRSDDRWEWDGAEQREKYVTGEMIAGVVYRCQVVVTNPTSREQKLDVLLQIPRGAVPVASGFFTRTVNLRLSPYATESIEYAFYFPRPGHFTHFPAHVTKGLELQIAAEARELEVVDAPTAVDLESWSHVSQHGSLDDVLSFLDRANLRRIDLERIAWRMHDRVAFERITARLASRHVYDDRLWRYALAHHDRRRASEWLRHQDDFLRPAGPALDRSPAEPASETADAADALVELDPIERGWYQHLEYAPLVNARAHQLGEKRRILNDALAQQYRSFLDVVAHRAHVTPDDLLGAAHYLLCMDRIDDALAMLGRVAPKETSTGLQHDYLAAYCACYRGDLSAARQLATKWVEHPVDRWRNRFAILTAMLDEVEGGARVAMIDAESRDQRIAESASRQPALELTVSGTEIVLQHQNLTSCQLRFYVMDIELFFSRQPFVQGDIERFSFIEPGRVLDVPLSSSASRTQEAGRTVVPIPASLRGANLVIEAAAPSIRKSVAHYAHDLGVHVAQSYGQLRVVRASTLAPLPAAYVKVFARQRTGQTSFFKDGYTDLRGHFDYATLSTDDLDRVERFALLVVSDEAGATIVEALPPPR